MEPDVQDAQSLEVRQFVPGTPTAVFDAWVAPELLTRWFSPSADYAVVVHLVDARVGGRYRIEMRHPNGASHVATGEYRELERPGRLAFTWKWEGTPMDDTMVEVVLRPRGRGTEVVLTHTRFATADERDQHRDGWTGCLARLAESMADA